MPKDKIPTPEEFSEITRLASELLSAKVTEAAANASRTAVEAKLAMLIPGPEEGQRTISLADKKKVVVERGFNYKADLDAIEKEMAGNEFAPPIESKATRKLDMAGYRWFRENHPSTFLNIAKHVEAKPKKISVTVKVPK